MHGKGIFTWTEGQRYEGDYKDDKMHGRGVYTTKEGSKFSRQWVEDKMQV
jgi:hypothetical protein